MVTTHFQWADELADVFRPEFGSCHLRVIDAPPTYNACACVEVMYYPKHGPPGLGARTYIGMRLAKMIGLGRLQAAVEHVEEREWGVIADLVKDPWTKEPDILVQRHQETLALLADTGVFGDYRVAFKETPGAKDRRINKCRICVKAPLIVQRIECEPDSYSCADPKWIPPDVSAMPAWTPPEEQEH